MRKINKMKNQFKDQTLEDLKLSIIKGGQTDPPATAESEPAVEEMEFAC